MSEHIDFMNVDKLYADLEADASQCQSKEELGEVFEVVDLYFYLMRRVQKLPLVLRLVYWAMSFHIYLYLRFRKQLNDDKQGFDKVVVNTVYHALEKVKLMYQEPK